MAKSDDLFGDDPEIERQADEFERLHRALLERLEDFMEKEDLDDEYVVDLLLHCAINLRMSVYGMVTEKPSVAGFKLDLDRFRQHVDHVVREAKKSGDDFIALVKETRAAQEGAEDT